MQRLFQKPEKPPSVLFETSNPDTKKCRQRNKICIKTKTDSCITEYHIDFVARDPSTQWF